jgi:signal transduction histidine kinase
LVVAAQEIVLHEAATDALQRQLVLLLTLVLTMGAALTAVLRLQRRGEVTEKFAMIGRLSGGLAHELGSPLSVIGMRAEAIALQSPPGEAAHAHALAISAEVARLTAFITGLLHLASGRGVPATCVDAREVIDRAAADLLKQAADARIRMVFDKPQDPALVRGDRSMLAHAVRNVMRNAIQALREHPGPRAINVAVRKDGDRVVISVLDNGPGIPADQISLVGEPFHTTKPIAEGMGLGFAITRGIVREHGGQTTIENNDSGGVRVTIRLPRHLREFEGR